MIRTPHPPDSREAGHGAFSGPGRYLMSMLLRQARAGSREGSVVLGRGLALLFFFAASARVEAQCTLASTPVAFEPNPPGVIRVWSMEGSYSTSLALYQSGAGSNRMMMSESFGYSILDLSNPGNPVALLYDDFRFATTNPLQQHGDGQSAIQTFGVSPDGQRATFSVNGPFDPPWHTIGARNYGGEGFGLWGDFAPNRALGTVVQHVNGRYIAYAIHGSINMTAADITTLPSALAPYNSCTPGTSCQAFDSTGFPQAYSPPLYLAGNYLVYETGTYQNTSITVIDASNPGPAGRITSAYKSLTIPYGTANSSYYPMNFTVALDPGDSTKLWILVENLAAPGDKSPSYGLVAVTKDGGGNLTATPAPGPFKVPAAGGETWGTAGSASSLVAVNGTLFAVMWAQRSLPSAQTGFYATTVSAWPAAGAFQAVTAPGFNLPATHASALAGSGASAYQYFPTGPSAYVVPLTCTPFNVPASSILTVTNTSAGGAPISSGGTAFIGDTLTVVPFVGPSPLVNPLTSWAFDFDFHADNATEDAGVSPRIKNPDNGVFGNPASPPAQAILTGPCDPKGVPAGDPPSGTSCWTSVLNNATTGGPDFTGSDAAGTTKPLKIAFEATNGFGIADTAVFTVNWVVPAAKVVSTNFLSGQSLVSASDGHPLATGYTWYFGNTPTTLTKASSCTGPTCLPTTSPLTGTYYYWLTVTYANGYATPDYDGATHVGLPFTVTNFAPSFTVNGSAAGPVSAYVSQNLTISNSSQRGSGITGSYSYDICPSPCTATYTGPTGGAFTGMTDPSSPSGTPPSSATLALPSTAGTYTLRFRITYAGGTAYWPDPAGVTGFTLNVTNVPPPVFVTASATPNPANSGASIQFSCSATGGSGTFTDYSWVYTSFTFSHLQNPVISSFTNSGTGLTLYPVSCVVTDSNGTVGSASFTLTVKPPPPVVTASATPNPAANGATVQFTCSATGGSGSYTSYSWATPSGTFSALRNPTIVASNPGSTAMTVPVTCAVTDSYGSQGSATVNLTINAAIPVVVTATATPNPAASGATVQFGCAAAGGTGTFTSYSWSTPAGTFATSQTPTMQVVNSGTTATVTAVTCTATDSMVGQGSGSVNLTVESRAAGPLLVLRPHAVSPVRHADGGGEPRNPARGHAGPRVRGGLHVWRSRRREVALGQRDGDERDRAGIPLDLPGRRPADGHEHRVPGRGEDAREQRDAPARAGRFRNDQGTEHVGWHRGPHRRRQRLLPLTAQRRRELRLSSPSLPSPEKSPPILAVGAAHGAARVDGRAPGRSARERGGAACRCNRACFKAIGPSSRASSRTRRTSPSGRPATTCRRSTPLC